MRREELARQDFDDDPDPEKRERCWDIYDTLEVELLVPILFGVDLLGVIAVGRKLSGERLATDDRQLLRTLANQSSIAIENAKAFDEIAKLNESLEMRVEERTRELQDTQNQLMQSEKLKSLGQLVAGVAHELNNPIGFVHANLQLIDEFVDKAAAARDAGRGEEDRHREAIKKLLCAHGRVPSGSKQIVQDLRTFSRMDQADLQMAQLTDEIDRTLALMEPQLKGSIEVVKDYETLPEVRCFPGQLNQVFLNLLMNACDVLEDGGMITIRTRPTSEGVRLRFEDTGPGIPPDVASRIFDPFFTTKEIGKGTGLGLSLSHGIIERHGGRIQILSEPGRKRDLRDRAPPRGAGDRGRGAFERNCESRARGVTGSGPGRRIERPHQKKGDPPMKLGLIAGYSPATMSVPIDLIKEAERLGYDSVWTAEAWGSDAATPAAWILALTEKINVGTAIMQMPGRTPAMTAMTAMTLYAMSGGRFILGLGPSGPQVVEGWHGCRLRQARSRARRNTSRSFARFSSGRRSSSTKASTTRSRSRARAPRVSASRSRASCTAIPALNIYTASISPNGMKCAGEVSDGVFPVWMNPERYDIFEESLNEGFAAAGGGKSLDDFEIAPFCTVILNDDLEKARMPVKNNLALYIGGMGARDKNFYNDYCKRLGYPDAAKEIQDLYLSGKKAEAAAAVPDALVDDVALVGPADRIRDRLQAWKAAGEKRHVGSLLAGTGQPEALRLLAEEVL